MSEFCLVASGECCGVLDVGYAVMEGATDLVHGVLPYGHIADVLHGDTYPIGSYLLYAPFAPFWPVHTVWDDANVTLVVAVVAALGVASTAWRISSPSGGSTTGPRMAIAALTFPPLLVTVSTGTKPTHPVDRVVEVLSGAETFQRRGWRESLHRLREILEGERQIEDRVAVGGGNRYATGIP